MSADNKPATLAENIAAFEDSRDQLERERFGRWAVFHNAALAGDFPDLQEAAAFAVQNYGRGPYMIRQIGAPPPQVRSRIV